MSPFVELRLKGVTSSRLPHHAGDSFVLDLQPLQKLSTFHFGRMFPTSSTSKWAGPEQGSCLPRVPRRHRVESFFLKHMLERDEKRRFAVQH